MELLPPSFLIIYSFIIFTQLRYVIRGLGKWNKRNVLFILDLKATRL